MREARPRGDMHIIQTALVLGHSSGDHLHDPSPFLESLQSALSREEGQRQSNPGWPKWRTDSRQSVQWQRSQFLLQDPKGVL